MEKDLKQNYAKYVFLYLISLVSLIFLAVNSGTALFQVIDKNIKDILQEFYYSSSSLKFALSAILISAPVYFYSVFLINRDKEEVFFKKWLVYLILFISFCVMSGWVIAIFYQFLEGELGEVFALKALTAVLIAGMIFSYYFFDLKSSSLILRKRYFAVATIFVLMSFLLGLFFVESPFQARKRKIDNVILNQFNAIDSGLRSYYASNNNLPDNLSVLIDGTAYFLSAKDIKNKVTGKDIEYRKIDKQNYSLCADFNLSNFEADNNSDFFYQENLWQHGSGYQCIKKKIDVSIDSKSLPAIVR